MTDVEPSWNIGTDLEQVFRYHFMVNALLAGTVVAVVAGCIGYLMVLRRQSFVGHTLAVAGFPGAAGAALVGLNPLVGYFGFCVGGALLIALAPQRGGLGAATPGRGEETAVIGTVQAVALASGFLFVSLADGFSGELTTLLFGTITGVSDSQVLVLAIAGTVALGMLAFLGRRLLFATVDADMAASRGIPVRWVSTGFLVLLGIAAAGTSQVTGSLLVFALLVAPAATAIRITARPALGVMLAVLIGLLVVWVGEIIAFYSPYPIGFWVTSLGFAAFLLAAAGRATADRFGQRRFGDTRRSGPGGTAARSAASMAG